MPFWQTWREYPQWNATEGIFELLKFENLSKGIKVIQEDNMTVIELHVILEYGVKISTVGQNIIDRVKFNVENMTGITIDRIDVIVDGIRFE